MRRTGRTIFAILAALVAGPALATVARADADADEPRFDMTRAVACSRVDGFEDYVPLPKPKLTCEDKLKVYFRPLNYRVEPFKTRYRARLIEDGQIRRKGEKVPLSREDKLLEYEANFDSPTYQIYLTNTIGLKNLTPGEYEFDIVLHDALVEGSSARQTLSFTIIPTPKPARPPDAEGPDESGDPPGPAGKTSTKKGKPARSPRGR